MISGIIEGGAALLIGLVGGIYIIGQLKNNAERNSRDIEDIKGMMREYQEGIKTMMMKNISDMKELLDANKEHQRDALNMEISHIKDLISISNAETREDIKRLEAAQKESNCVKERIAIMESSLRRIHHRIDLDSTQTPEASD